jgi:hypothetical protein
MQETEISSNYLDQVSGQTNALDTRTHTCTKARLKLLADM